MSQDKNIRGIAQAFQLAAHWSDIAHRKKLSGDFDPSPLYWRQARNIVDNPGLAKVVLDLIVGTINLRHHKTSQADDPSTHRDDSQSITTKSSSVMGEDERSPHPEELTTEVPRLGDATS